MYHNSNSICMPSMCDSTRLLNLFFIYENKYHFSKSYMNHPYLPPSKSGRLWSKIYITLSVFCELTNDNQKIVFWPLLTSIMFPHLYGLSFIKLAWKPLFLSGLQCSLLIPSNLQILSVVFANANANAAY